MSNVREVPEYVPKRLELPALPLDERDPVRLRDSYTELKLPDHPIMGMIVHVPTFHSIFNICKSALSVFLDTCPPSKKRDSFLRNLKRIEVDEQDSGGCSVRNVESLIKITECAASELEAVMIESVSTRFYAYLPRCVIYTYHYFNEELTHSTQEQLTMQVATHMAAQILSLEASRKNKPELTSTVYFAEFGVDAPRIDREMNGLAPAHKFEGRFEQELGPYRVIAESQHATASLLAETDYRLLQTLFQDLEKKVSRTRHTRHGHVSLDGDLLVHHCLNDLLHARDGLDYVHLYEEGAAVPKFNFTRFLLKLRERPEEARYCFYDPVTYDVFFMTRHQSFRESLQSTQPGAEVSPFFPFPASAILLCLGCFSILCLRPASSFRVPRIYP